MCSLCHGLPPKLRRTHISILLLQNLLLQPVCMYMYILSLVDTQVFVTVYMYMWVFAVQIKVNDDARNGAWLSFDGRNRAELQKGDTLVHSLFLYRPHAHLQVV